MPEKSPSTLPERSSRLDRRARRRLLSANWYAGAGTWLYERYGSPTIALHHRRLAERIAREAPAHSRVLDVGSGPGDLFLRLARLRADLDLVGIDIARSAVCRARRRARLQHASRVRFVCAGAERLPFPDAWFAVAVSVGAYKHWTDRLAALREVRRVLVPGGKLLLSELDPDAEGARLTDVGGAYPWVSRAVLRRFLLPTSLPRGLARDELCASGLSLAGEGLCAGLPFYEFEGEKRC